MTKLPGIIPLGFLLLIAAVGVFIYAALNFSRYGKIFGREEYLRLEIAELLSFGNLYSSKLVCSRGYFVQDKQLSIFKVRLDEDRYTRSAWVERGDFEIITEIADGKMRAREVELCGKFESARDGEFGEPPIWISQITVDNYTTFGDSFDVEGEI